MKKIAVNDYADRHHLARERDRLQLLPEVNNILVSNLDLRELLSAISACLRKVMPHDSTALGKVTGTDGGSTVDMSISIADEIFLLKI